MFLLQMILSPAFAAEIYAQQGEVLTTPREKPEEKIAIVRIALFPWGFQPPNIKRPEGKCLLVLADYTGLENARFEIVQKNNKARIYDVEFPKFKNQWIRQVNISAGNYLVRRVDNPEKSLEITITK
jgi:hypothetical protein